MDILFANKFFFLNGGSERVFFQERQYLLENGHNVFDFCMEDVRNLDSPYNSYFVPNVDYRKSSNLKEKISQGLSFIHSSNAISKIKQLASDKKPQIAHFHNVYHQLTPSVIPVLKKQKIKVVLTLHDTKLVCPSYISLSRGEICDECQGHKFWKPITRHCQSSWGQELLLSAEALFHQLHGSYNEVDLFIAPSQFLANLISQRIPCEKIRILRNGIDVKEYRPNYDDTNYGLYFGRISKEKGVQTLLRAQMISSEALPLRVVGTGPLKGDLEKQFPMVEFLGYKSGEDLNNLIKNAAYVVVPSEWYENCSMVVLEAMAFGKPVIGSRIGGIPEQIEDGKTGLLFEMGNYQELSKKMTILSIDKALRYAYGKATREKVEKEFSLDGHCSKLIEIYEELFKDKA